MNKQHAKTMSWAKPFPETPERNCHFGRRKNITPRNQGLFPITLVTWGGTSRLVSMNCCHCQKAKREMTPPKLTVWITLSMFFNTSLFLWKQMMVSWFPAFIHGQHLKSSLGTHANFTGMVFAHQTLNRWENMVAKEKLMFQLWMDNLK